MSDKEPHPFDSDTIMLKQGFEINRLQDQVYALMQTIDEQARKIEMMVKEKSIWSECGFPAIENGMKIVDMVSHGGNLYVATENALWVRVDGEFKKVKFMEEV